MDAPERPVIEKESKGEDETFNKKETPGFSQQEVKMDDLQQGSGNGNGNGNGNDRAGDSCSNCGGTHDRSACADYEVRDKEEPRQPIWNSKQRSSSGFRYAFLQPPRTLPKLAPRPTSGTYQPVAPGSGQQTYQAPPPLQKLTPRPTSGIKQPVVDSSDQQTYALVPAPNASPTPTLMLVYPDFPPQLVQSPVTLYDASGRPVQVFSLPPHNEGKKGQVPIATQQQFVDPTLKTSKSSTRPQLSHWTSASNIFSTMPIPQLLYQNDSRGKAIAPDSQATTKSSGNRGRGPAASAIDPAVSHDSRGRSRSPHRTDSLGADSRLYRDRSR